MTRTSSEPRDPGVAFLANTLRPVIDLMGGHHWLGAENIPPTGPAIICPNHLSNVDPILIGHYLYDNGRMPYFLAKDSLFKLAPVGRALRGAGQIPVMRDTKNASGSLRFAREALEQGKVVVVYPEGTLTRDPDLWPMRGKTGAARLAMETRAPVVPVAHWGLQQVLPPYAKFPKVIPRRRFTVLAGPPVDLRAFAERSLDTATLHEATDVIQDAIAALLARLRGEDPPRQRFVYRGPAR